jgi:N-acetyl sugar amidotransferase
MTHLTRSYEICARCVMDTVADPDIVFGPNGMCNHCARYDRLLPMRVHRGAAGQLALQSIIERIRAAGRGSEYDCIIGVSGGVDSTYVAYLVVEHGLRPLAVHLDNGWNSELAIQNIQRTVDQLGIDLHTVVLDWEEFRDLQVAFLKASTPDGEIVTDHAISATLWREASARGIRYIISGMNFATESMSVPRWAYGHSDWRYIRDVQQRHGTIPLRTYPHYTLAQLVYWNTVARLRTVSILNYVDYQKAAAVAVLRDSLGWRSYGGKHHESIYTRWFQGFFLPTKFGIDKRIGHFSDLIKAGQMDREEALAQLKMPTYDPAVQTEDTHYVKKKLRLSDDDFALLLKLPVRTFREFRNSFDQVQFLRRSIDRIRGLGWAPR